MPSHCRMRVFDRDLIRGGHYGQRSCEPHLQAEHMAAPTNAANVKKALANSEPSTHGTKRTSACALHMSAFGGKADIAPCRRVSIWQKLTTPWRQITRQRLTFDLIIQNLWGQDSPMIQACLDSVRSEKEATKPTTSPPAKSKKK